MTPGKFKFLLHLKPHYLSRHLPKDEAFEII